jgi:signal transduction histidine kinase/CheY-like chemotaxis protein
MMSELAPAQAVLAGGGEMGKLMRSFEWSRTPVGPVEQWPQSLRTSLSILLASGYPMYIAWGPDFIQFYNDAYRPILGSSKHPAALGRSSTETFAEIWDFIGPMFEGVLRDGTTSTYIDQLLPLDRNGYLEECYFDFSYSPVGAESGAIGGVFVTCTETTGRVLGDRRLRTLRDLAASGSEAQTAAQACRRATEVLAANAADLPFALLYLLDSEARHARLVGATGLAPGEPSSPVELEIVSDCVWPCAEAIEHGRALVVSEPDTAAGVLPGGPWPEPCRTALVLPLAQAGQEHPAGLLVAGISPRRALDEDYRGFVQLVAVQIATVIANARAYEAERHRAEALAELDRAKTTFFSNVSHEFRTPLALLLGPVEDALADADEPLLPRHRERLEVAHRNGLRLLKLVNTLLDFARIEAGRVQAAYQATDLAALTAELASVFRSAMERAGLRLIVDCPAVGEDIYVDRDMWEKIVLNLLSNAFKFTLSGEIAVSLRDAGERVELVVRDTGVGIAAEELPHIFERFHRVKTTQARTFEGTGIGLALVYELVKLHGGDIGVESTPGAGTTFVASVPKGAAHLDPERIGAERSQASTALGQAPYLEEALRWLPESTSPDLEPWEAGSVEPLAFDSPATTEGIRSARILVVDDNADMLDYIRRLLTPSYQVAAASDGSAALSLARTEPLDLVLADVMMPGLDGFGLLRALRADPRTALLPIVLLSARAGEEAKVEGLEAGADDYLVKPFAARELLARVDAHLALARARDAASRREQAARAEAEAERQRLHQVFMQAPAAICLLRGPEHRFELANPLYPRLVGKSAEQLIGKPLIDALPEIANQPFVEVLDRVRATGERFIGNEVRALLARRGDRMLDEAYVNFVYEPLRDGSGASNTSSCMPSKSRTWCAPGRLPATTRNSSRPSTVSAGSWLRNSTLTASFSLSLTPRLRQPVPSSAPFLQPHR